MPPFLPDVTGCVRIGNFLTRFGFGFGGYSGTCVRRRLWYSNANSKLITRYLITRSKKQDAIGAVSCGLF